MERQLASETPRQAAERQKKLDAEREATMKAVRSEMSDFSHRHRFADWPNSEVPAVAAGVYVVWEGDKLIYMRHVGP